MKSVPLAVERLKKEISAALTAIKPDVLIEFRQSYVGPGIRQCGNMISVGDCPGDMETPMILTGWHATGDYEKAKADMAAEYPAKKNGHPREVAQMVLFLASDESSYVNATYMIVDGGLLAKVY